MTLLEQKQHWVGMGQVQKFIGIAIEISYSCSHYKGEVDSVVMIDLRL
jgi:hypothetical protein